MKRKAPIEVTETTRFGSGYETVNRYVGRRSVSPLAMRINTVMMPVSLALAIMVFSDTPSPVRVWLTVLVIAFGPGSALVQYIRLPDPALQLGLTMAIGGAIGVLLAQLLLLVHNIDPLLAVSAITGLTFLHPIARQEKRATREEPSE